MQSNSYQAKLKEIRSDLTKKYPRANIFEIKSMAFKKFFTDPEVVYHLNDPAIKLCFAYPAEYNHKSLNLYNFLKQSFSEELMCMKCILGDFGFISEIFKKCVNLMPEDAKYDSNFEELIQNNKVFEDQYKKLVNELEKEERNCGWQKLIQIVNNNQLSQNN